jgi:hypothetical protein
MVTVDVFLEIRFRLSRFYDLVGLGFDDFVAGG